MKTIKVESRPHLVRDINTGAILNTDIAKNQSKEKIDSTEKRISQLEANLDEIRQLLTKILEK